MYRLSARELLELAERLATHGMIVEKLGFMAAEAEDGELQQILRRHQQTYLQQYNEMASWMQMAQGGYWQAYGQPYPPSGRSSDDYGPVQGEAGSKGGNRS